MYSTAAKTRQAPMPYSYMGNISSQFITKNYEIQQRFFEQVYIAYRLPACVISVMR